MTAQRVEGLIHVVRGQRVMLDVDLARLYEVTVGALNQAVKRNPARFPDDFAFQLAPQEAAHLKSQIVISNWGGWRSPPALPMPYTGTMWVRCRRTADSATAASPPVRRRCNSSLMFTELVVFIWPARRRDASGMVR